MSDDFHLQAKGGDMFFPYASHKAPTKRPITYEKEQKGNP